MLARRSLRLAASLLSPRLVAGALSELPLLQGSQTLLHALGSSGACTSSGSTCWNGSSLTSASSSSSSISSSSLGFAPSWLFSWRPFSAATAAEPDAQNAAVAAAELPLWRFLRQRGFSAESIERMRSQSYTRSRMGGRRYKQVTGRRVTEQKLQRDLAPNIAALRAEGLDTASIQRLFEQHSGLLVTTHATFSSAAAALRRLAALLPDDPRAVQAPPGATQLGVALWLYPTGGASLLMRANLGSLIDGNLQLRRQLGVSDAATALVLFQKIGTLATNFEQAEAMAAHLQHQRASGTLSEEQVGKLALSGALLLPPAEFDRRRQEGGASALASISCNNPAERQQAAAEALGELLQAAYCVTGPLQPQYMQQGDALVRRNQAVWGAGPAALRAGWASLQQLGLSSSQIVSAVQTRPTMLSYDWEGEAKQRLLAWVQQELGLSPAEFLTRHAGYATNSVARLAMRADFLRQHRPTVWQAKLARGTGALLSLLTESRSCQRAGCIAAELAAYNRAWLATCAGRRWGKRSLRVRRPAAELTA